MLWFARGTLEVWSQRSFLQSRGHWVIYSSQPVVPRERDASAAEGCLDAEFAVEQDEVSIIPWGKTSFALVDADSACRSCREHQDSIFKRHTDGLHKDAQRLIHGEHTTRDSAVSEPSDIWVDPGETASKAEGGSWWETSPRLGIGDHYCPARAERMDQNTHHDRQDMVTIGDEFTEGAFLLDQCAKRAGRPVEERRHGIEAVGEKARTMSEGYSRLLIRSLSVADGHEYASSDEAVENVEGTREFGCERHDPKVAARCGEQTFSERKIGTAKPRSVVCTATGRIQKWPLEIDAQWLSARAIRVGDCQCSGRKLALGEIVWHTNDVDEECSGAGTGNPASVGENLFGLGGVQRKATSTMGMEIKKAGEDEQIRDIDNDATKRHVRSHGDDAPACKHDPFTGSPDPTVNELSSNECEMHGPLPLERPGDLAETAWGIGVESAGLGEGDREELARDDCDNRGEPLWHPRWERESDIRDT